MDEDRQAVIKEVLEAIPSWVNELIQLNTVVADRMGVLASDLNCLDTLQRLGPATAATLATRIGLTPGSVSRMIDRLDTAGFIQRTPDPNDRRRVLVEPTVEGLERIATYYAGLTARTHEDLDVFDEHELRSLLRFIAKSHHSAETEVTRLRQAG